MLVSCCRTVSLFQFPLLDKTEALFPLAAQTIMGKGGAAAVLLLMFMSCTSAISAQLIGVSTVISYDIYRTYL